MFDNEPTILAKIATIRIIIIMASISKIITINKDFAIIATIALITILEIKKMTKIVIIMLIKKLKIITKLTM